MSRTSGSGRGLSHAQKTEHWRKAVKFYGKRKHRRAERDAARALDFDDRRELRARTYKRAEDVWAWD